MIVYQDDFFDIYYPLCYKEIADFSVGDFEDDFFTELEIPMLKFDYRTSIIVHNKVLPNSNPHYIFAFCIYPKYCSPYLYFRGSCSRIRSNDIICMLADGSHYNAFYAYKEIKSYSNIDINKFVKKPLTVLGELAEQGEVNAIMRLGRIYKHMREYEEQNDNRYNINWDFSVVEQHASNVHLVTASNVHSVTL